MRTFSSFEFVDVPQLLVCDCIQGFNFGLEPPAFMRLFLSERLLLICARTFSPCYLQSSELRRSRCAPQKAWSFTSTTANK